VGTMRARLRTVNKRTVAASRKPREIGRPRALMATYVDVCGVSFR